MASTWKKAITFSYDDGVEQDKRLIDLFDRYGLKATFNLNSELLGKKNDLICEGIRIKHNKICQEEVRQVYRNHEVAVHTLTHPNLADIAEDSEIIRQVEQDRKNLSRLVGYEVNGMAYPCGGINYTEHVAELIANCTGVKYARTIECNYSFNVQKELYQFKPTVYHIMEFDTMYELAKKFLESECEERQILYIWGHSYEFDIHNTWEKFEEFLRMIAGKKDIFYGTNREVLRNSFDHLNSVEEAIR